MNPPPRIPAHPLEVNHNNSGLPMVDLMQRGRLFYQKSSRAHLKFMAAMLVPATIAWLLPWDADALGGLKARHWVAMIFLWGGVCVSLCFRLRDLLGQTIIIDPYARSLTIKTYDARKTVDWNDILGLQLCHDARPKDPGMTGYQLNLVWQDAGGRVLRHCLCKHTNRKVVAKLGRKYLDRFPFRQLGSAWA